MSRQPPSHSSTTTVRRVGMDDEYVPPSAEVLAEEVRRLDAYQLDDRIAVSRARRDVAAAYGFDDLADVFDRALRTWEQARRERG
jgi:hypothetical protein